MSEGGDGEVPHREQIPVFTPTTALAGPSGEKAALTTPEDYPSLSPRLVEGLIAWQERWEGGRGSPERYRGMTNSPDAQAELDRLTHHLAGVLRDVADVRTETWSSTD